VACKALNNVAQTGSLMVLERIRTLQSKLIPFLYVIVCAAPPAQYIQFFSTAFLCGMVSG